MCYDRMACLSWDALSKLIHRVEYLENEVFRKKKEKSKYNIIQDMEKRFRIKIVKNDLSNHNQ